MAHFRVLPHRVASSESISIVRWWYQLENDTVRDLPDAIPGWDYNTSLVVGVDIDVDLEELSASTGLPTDLIAAVATLDCPTVAERFTKKAAIVDGTQSIAVKLPRGRGADTLTASIHLVAARAASGGPEQSRTRAAARLFDSEPQRARLEGTGGRFPVEVCKFSSIGFESAPWTVVTDFDDLNDSFLGSVRLFVNSEHPLGASAAAPSKEGSSAFMMQIDTMRLLISEIARSGMYEPNSSWPEESVAHVVDSMCLAYFNRQLDTMINLLTNDPSAFDRTLHDSISFEGVSTL